MPLSPLSQNRHIRQHGSLNDSVHQPLAVDHCPPQVRPSHSRHYQLPRPTLVARSRNQPLGSRPATVTDCLVAASLQAMIAMASLVAVAAVTDCPAAASLQAIATVGLVVVAAATDCPVSASSQSSSTTGLVAVAAVTDCLVTASLQANATIGLVAAAVHASLTGAGVLSARHRSVMLCHGRKVCQLGSKSNRLGTIQHGPG
jgi:hypothetical protein